jgi:hypothetical protein
VGIVLTLRAHSEWIMIGSRLTPRQRRGCRAVGASFVAAATLPLFAITPLAQADPGHGQGKGQSHGGQAAAHQAPIANHIDAMVRAEAPEAKKDKPAPQSKKQSSKSADKHVTTDKHQSSQHQSSKSAEKHEAKSAAKGHADKAPVATSHESAAKGDAADSTKQLRGSKAHHKVYICHATNSDTNPYVVVWVSVASVQFRGHLMHVNEPNKTWKHAGSWNDVPHSANDAKPDIILWYTESKGHPEKITKPDCGKPGKTTTPPGNTTPPDDKPTTPQKPSTPPGNGGTPGNGNTPGNGGIAPGNGNVVPPARVLPIKVTNSSNPDSSANAQTPQVLGEKVSALPRTGANMLGAALLSLLMLTFGGLLLRLSSIRRRRTH